MERVCANNEQYDRHGVNMLMKGGLGLMAFIPAAVLFRGRGSRNFVTAAGFGFGCGVAFQQSRTFLAHGEQVQPLPKSFGEELGCWQKMVLSYRDIMPSIPNPF